MDFRLIISAQTLRLASELQKSNSSNGHIVIKNVPAKTYLRITPEQWVILQEFEETRNVPSVLDHAVRERKCLPLGEFYELILKALRTNILLDPAAKPESVKACEWRGAVRPHTLARPIGVLFCVGMVMAFGFRPELPTSPLDVVTGIGILSAAFSCAALLAGSIIRGAEGEVYHPRWDWKSIPPQFKIDTSDMIMLPRKAQDIIITATPAVLATAAGITAWYRPEWSFIPLLGLIVNLRPVLGGQFATVVRLGHEDVQSDAHHAFIFPPNQTPAARWRTLKRALGQANTWVTNAYAVIWTLAVIYLGARLTDAPPWSIEFWEANGARIAVAIGGSLALLGVSYFAWELYLFIRARMVAWRYAVRQWYRRWFSAKNLVLDETQRLEAVAGSGLLRALSLPQRQQFVQATKAARFGPWSPLPDYGGVASKQVALIVSGKVALQRVLPTGRKIRVQILEAGDVIGLQADADPQRPDYALRTMTPVTLLTLSRAQADELVVSNLPPGTLKNTVFKLPFLRSVSLCENWHLKAIERFALASSVIDYPDDQVIFTEGMLVDQFFIIIEGGATVTKEQKKLGAIRAGEYFGEIGLLQNSAASATITAKRNTRCLAIERKEFLRFVTHNYMVALELEQVSSKRLRRPIFPVRRGDAKA